MFLFFSAWHSRRNHLWQRYPLYQQRVQGICWQVGIHHDYSNPHYPRGHGFIEWQVKIIMRLFNKCDEYSTNHQVPLQELRATPLDSDTPAPAEILHGRQMKTTWPAIIKPPWNREVVRASLQSRHDFSRYDAQAKERSTLLPTQPFGTRLYQPQMESRCGSVQTWDTKIIYCGDMTRWIQKE